MTHRRTRLAASRCDPVLGIERRRRSARDADAEQRSRLRFRRDRHPQRARRRQRRRRLVAQRGVRHPRQDSDVGLLELAAGRRRRRHRRGGREACRVRRRDGRAALDRRRRRLQLQLAAAGHDRRRRAGGVHERARHDQRRAGHRQRALGVRVVGRRDRSAGDDGGRRRPGQHDLHERRASGCAALRSRTRPADGRRRSAGRRSG